MKNITLQQRNEVELQRIIEKRKMLNYKYNYLFNSSKSCSISSLVS